MQQEQQQVTHKAKVIKNVLIIETFDPLEYMIGIDIIPLITITRVRYNAVTGGLTIYLPETVGNVQDQMVPIPDKEGKPTEETRFAIYGQTSSYQITLGDEPVIRTILKQILDVPNDLRLDEVFEGFKARKRAQVKLDEMRKQAEKLQAERGKNTAAETSQEGKIVNIHGKTMESEPTK